MLTETHAAAHAEAHHDIHNFNNFNNFNLYLAGNVIQESAAALEKTAQQCGCRYELALSNLLQTDVHVETMVEVEQLALHGETNQKYYRNWVVVNDDTQSLAIVSVDRELTGVCLDLICGGSGKLAGGDHEQGIHSGEHRVLDKIIRELFKCVTDSYPSSFPVKLDIATKTQEMEAQHRTTTKREFIACVHFIVCIGNYSGDILMMLPAPVVARISIARQHHRYNCTETALKQKLTQVSLPLTAILGQQQTTLSQAMRLKSGDIIPLYKPLDADVFIGKKYFGKAKVIADSGRLSLQIHNPAKSLD